MTRNKKIVGLVINLFFIPTDIALRSITLEEKKTVTNKCLSDILVVGVDVYPLYFYSYFDMRNDEDIARLALILKDPSICILHCCRFNILKDTL